MSQKHRRPGVETEAPDANESSHILKHLPDDATPIWKLTVGELRTLLGVAPAATPTDALVPVTTADLAKYGVGPTRVRAAIDAGELPGVQGRRRRLCVHESRLIKWRDSHPMALRPPRKSRPITGINEDPLEQMIAHEEMRATRRGSRSGA